MVRPQTGGQSSRGHDHCQFLVCRAESTVAASAVGRRERVGEGEGTVDSYDNTSPKSVFGAYDDNYLCKLFLVADWR